MHWKPFETMTISSLIVKEFSEASRRRRWKFWFKLTEIFPALIVDATAFNCRHPMMTWKWKVFDYVLRACINFIDLNWKTQLPNSKFLITSPLKLLVRFHFAIDVHTKTSVWYFNFLLLNIFGELSGVTICSSRTKSLRNMWGLNYPFFDRKLIGSEKGYSDGYDGRDFRVIISHDMKNMLGMLTSEPFSGNRPWQSKWFVREAAQWDNSAFTTLDNVRPQICFGRAGANLSCSNPNPTKKTFYLSEQFTSSHTIITFNY